MLRFFPLRLRSLATVDSPALALRPQSLPGARGVYTANEGRRVRRGTSQRTDKGCCASLRGGEVAHTRQ